MFAFIINRDTIFGSDIEFCDEWPKIPAPNPVGHGYLIGGISYKFSEFLSGIFSFISWDPDL